MTLCIAEDYKVITRGYIVVTDSTIIHCVSLGHDTYKVVIKTVIHLDAHLRIPIDDEIVFIKVTINTMVA